MDGTSNYPGLTLLPQHEALLAASGISPEAATARGYRSVKTKTDLRRLGFGPSQLAVPALALPVYSALTGQVAFSQVRPDDPRVTADGRVVKYETPAKVRMALDAHPFTREALGDPSRPLWITEGIRKADAAVSRGLCCIALLGVWNWRGTNGAGGKTALPDWEGIALNGRDIFVVFDSDVMLKPEVHAACDRLGRFLSARGAKVRFVYLPQEGAAKVGLDDSLAAGHSVEELTALAEPRLRRPDRAATETPAPEAVPAGAAVLDQVAEFVRRFVVLTEYQARAVALWAAHTHAVDAAEATPFLAITSPEKRSGKTRLLEVLDLLVARPWRATLPSEAVLFRKISEETPTLLLDETDAVFKNRGEAYEGVRALLNAGNRRGVMVTRCLGDDHELQEFSVFCPRALAGIGELPDTVADRSIPVRLQRRAAHERVEHFRFRAASAEAAPIREAMEAWATAHLDELRAARPEIPAALNDRAADGWEPLLAIADQAGGDWPSRAREAAVALHGDLVTTTETVGVQLLAAIRAALDGRDRISTEELVRALAEAEDLPLPGWWGRAIKDGDLRSAGRWLSSRLRPFGIVSKSVRLDDGTTPKGYTLDNFRDAFARYLPPEGGSTRHSATNGDNQGPAGNSLHATGDATSGYTPQRQPLQDKGCGVVACGGPSAEGVPAAVPLRTIRRAGRRLILKRAPATGGKVFRGRRRAVVRDSAPMDGSGRSWSGEKR